MNDGLASLAKAIGRGSAILFVGAGVSISVGLPSWEKLIEQMAKELGIDDEFSTRRDRFQTLAEYYRIRHGSIGPLRSWMVVRFRSDALGSTILFIGYSLSDPNIGLLLHRLWQTWHRSGYEKDRPPSFIFMTSRNPVEEAVLGSWGISAVVGELDDPQAALVNFLSQLAEAVEHEPKFGAAEPGGTMPAGRTDGTSCLEGS
nr:SIR2 family protein [Mesorhizobium sp. LNHC220B00]